ncbi:hypothetical protein [Mucilaginibacter sp. FT3.2]|uniref:hypothetical protein n=1 Tax=Mucilaginibacter sp. FT3.2 TaxID=2723090 RepID=UPI001622AFB2|nr:hypothetical protein [Mucilaginibacter sp. FT3.2]MBB6229876.1 hypothetical protein [Mucilaginibacter sp. FT3.2]
MKAELIAQYKAGLKMLADVVEKCPGSLWANNEYESAYWRIAYHALFYTSFYLAGSPDVFIPWEKHRLNYNFMGPVAHDNQPIVVTDIYTKAEILAYTETIANSLESQVEDTKYNELCGFNWVPLSRFGLHLYTIRHLQHHVGQLTERLHQVGIKGVKWER